MSCINDRACGEVDQKESARRGLGGRSRQLRADSYLYYMLVPQFPTAIQCVAGKKMLPHCRIEMAHINPQTVVGLICLPNTASRSETVMSSVGELIAFRRWQPRARHQTQRRPRGPFVSPTHARCAHRSVRSRLDSNQPAPIAAKKHEPRARVVGKSQVPSRGQCGHGPRHPARGQGRP